MSPNPPTRRRPAVQITDARAARLHRMVRLLDEQPRTRPELLQALQVGLRTFYRELELLRRCGVRVRLVRKQYQLQGSLAQAESLLPFPDPRLSFAEMVDKACGIAVISAEERELTFVNIVGRIDIDSLAELEGEFGIPKVSENR